MEEYNKNLFKSLNTTEVHPQIDSNREESQFLMKDHSQKEGNENENRLNIEKRPITHKNSPTKSTKPISQSIMSKGKSKILNSMTESERAKSQRLYKELHSNFNNLSAHNRKVRE